VFVYFRLSTLAQTGYFPSFLLFFSCQRWHMASKIVVIAGTIQKIRLSTLAQRLK
jgi:hypothetical protein